MTTSDHAMDAGSTSTRKAVLGVVIWLVAGTLSGLTAPIEDQPTLVWVIRIASMVLGVTWVVWLSWHERSLKQRGLPLNNDTMAVDLWTVAHTMIGVVLGSWGVPFPLVVVFTIGWEFYERYGGGIGSDESITNRFVDIAVAWIGWIVFAGITTTIALVEMPWLLPVTQSIIR